MVFLHIPLLSVRVLCKIQWFIWVTSQLLSETTDINSSNGRHLGATVNGSRPGTKALLPHKN
ncbi:hypothetical protein LB505_007911 [Fusarium chuoi]|nr:hypothetical protein LB505_007911 [Fusarium chuoi]